MLKRTMFALVMLLTSTGSLLAEEIRGSITKIEDDAFTIRTIVVDKGIGTVQQKTFKMGKDMKIIRVKVRGSEEMKLSLADLKMALKAGKVSVKITHDGGTCSLIKVIPAGLGG